METQHLYPKFSPVEYARRFGSFASKWSGGAWGQGIHKPFAGIPGFQGWPTTTFTFQKGMSIMIEPNPMTPDEKHGIFFGGLHVVEENGARCLQKYPEEFFVVNG